MAAVSNLWGQPRPENEPTPDPEADVEPIADDIEPESETPIEIVIEPVATRDGLPTMAQLDALSADLDEIDAALAAMDADPSLPGRAAGQRT